MSEYRRKRKNITSNEQKNNIRLSMSIREGINSELVSVSIDVSHEYLGRHKGISFLFTPQNPTIDLSATFNSEHYSVGTNDDKDQKYQLIIAEDEENYETEYPIETAKQSPNSAAKIETALFSSFAAVPIVANKISILSKF